MLLVCAFSDRAEGPMTMRRALAKSKNMVSIRLLQGIGTQYAQALRSYYRSSPGVAQYPKALEDLLQDERFVMNNFGGELSIALVDKN